VEDQIWDLVIVKLELSSMVKHVLHVLTHFVISAVQMVSLATAVNQRPS
jgi:hypothetical protein